MKRIHVFLRKAQSAKRYWVQNGSYSLICKLLGEIKRRFSDELHLQFLLWLKQREFKNDKHFDLSLVTAGFANRLAGSDHDHDILRRIVRAYSRAKEVQKTSGPSYQVSNEWLPIYERPLLEVMRALQEEDIAALARIYGNFMRDDCSIGLVGLPINMRKHFFGEKISNRNKKRFLVDFIHRYNLWESFLGTTHDTHDLVSPCIGNPYGVEIDGTFIKAGSDYLHYYATLIGRLTRHNSHRTVVELGGGFGGMAYYLVRDSNNITYIDFDLPENLALTAYYLLKAFPNKALKLFGEVDISDINITDNEIVLMPSFEISRMHDNCVDLLFNSYSLAEMSAETIKVYISEFMRIGRNYILHVNHNRDSVVVADDFGIDLERFDLLYKIPALWNGGRRSDMDEYEYLFKRIP